MDQKVHKLTNTHAFILLIYKSYRAIGRLICKGSLLALLVVHRCQEVDKGFVI